MQLEVARIRWPAIPVVLYRSLRLHYLCREAHPFFLLYNEVLNLVFLGFVHFNRLMRARNELVLRAPTQQVKLL